MPVEDYYVKPVALYESGTQRRIGYKMLIKHREKGQLCPALRGDPVYRSLPDCESAYANGSPADPNGLFVPQTLPFDESKSAYQRLYRSPGATS